MAFGLADGESVGGLLAQSIPTPALAHLDIDQQGSACQPGMSCRAAKPPMQAPPAG